ncbi:MAG: hypothetical protein Q4A10_05115 [Aerococcaceae bacterium]|nr:hypothetical protein [Aerococcaceae bacterium]
MKLYSERHGLRAPREKTYTINREMYFLLLKCCEKYKENLTHIFSQKCYHSFTESNYIVFDETGFVTRMGIKIPSLLYSKHEGIRAPESGEEYDQYALIDFIEFFAQNMRDINKRWNNDRYRNYQTIEFLDSSMVFIDFQETINEIFFEAGLLYEVTDDRVVERIVEYSPLTKEIENSISLIKEEDTKKLLNDAISLYRTPGLEARKSSVEKMWDAFERLKTYYTSLEKKESISKIVNDMADSKEQFIKLFDNEFKTLTTIGNQYRIRHHETNRINIDDVRYSDYLFNRCLSLIALAIQYLD